MSKGAILFAFNSTKFDYYKMAVATAKRINHFLNLPVTLITDESSIPKTISYKFDHTVVVEPDKNNIRDKSIWINKGRYQAYHYSIYDETLLLDADYLINSNKLSMTFELNTDFCCHDNTAFLMHPNLPQEVLSSYSYKTLWATVMFFKKSQRAKQIFECLEMVQKNYGHYANIHSFMSTVYRNDYALTLALRIANGHLVNKNDIIPWNLLHIGNNTSVYPNRDNEYNTEYTVMFDHWKNGKIRKEYITIKDLDFHTIDKENFMRLI